MAGTAKAYGLTPDQVLHGMSWANVLLYNAVIPVYRKPDGKGKGRQEVIRADDPANAERVRRMIGGMA